MILNILWHQRKFYVNLTTDFLVVAHEYFRQCFEKNFHLAFQVEIKVCRKQGPYLGIVLERKLWKLRFRVLEKKKNSACEEFIGNDVHFMLKRFKYQVFPDKNTLFSWTNWPCSIFCTVAVLPNLPTFLADFEKHKGIGSLFLGIWQFPQIQLYLAIQSKHKVDNSDKFKFWNRSMPISQVFSI